MPYVGVVCCRCVCYTAWLTIGLMLGCGLLLLVAVVVTVVFVVLHFKHRLRK